MKRGLIITAIIFVLIVSSFLLYSRFISTRGLIVKEFKVENSKIKDNFHGLKIVHLSDFHFGRTVNETEMKNIVEKVNILKPDIIVLTGDLLDRDKPLTSEEQNIVIDSLKKMSAKLGRFSVSGNHDFSHSFYENIIEKSGFTNLDNNFELIYNLNNEPIIIAGMSSNIEDDTLISTKLKELTNYLDENVELKKVFKILLMHEPDYVDKVNENLFDLILAGHSHNGQVRLPIIGALILPPGAKKYYENHYKIDNTEFYISSGLGTSSINFRFFNKPSFNLYRITK